MKVSLQSEVRENGIFLIERWESGVELAHGPIAVEQVEAYADQLKEVILAQAAQQRENLTAMARSDQQRAFFAQEEKPWLRKRK